MFPIVPVTKVEQARMAILLQIFHGQLLPGARLVESRLAEQLGISQATVNAALQDLNAQGIVTKLLNRSTNVRRYSLAEITNLFAVRRVLEPVASMEAARHLNAAGKARLLEEVDRMRGAARSPDIGRFCLADYSFHQALYQLTRNSFLEQACQAIAAAPFAYMLCNSERMLPTDYASLAEDHEVIVTALEQGPEAARLVVESNIDRWAQYSYHALDAAGAAVEREVL